MRIVLRWFWLPLAVVAAASPAVAQLTVVTDRAEYTVGETVAITIHNAGPSVAQFNSFPAYTLAHVESGACLYGCVGLPVIWDMQPGETLASSRATGNLPDPPGLYRIQLVGTSGDPGSVLTAEYLLSPAVGADASTWGQVKRLFH